MRKGKKVIALLLGMSMIAASFSACGSGDGDTATATNDASAENKANANGGDVNYNVDDVNVADGVEVPQVVENNADAQKISLKVWCPTEEQTITQQLCEAFDGAHPEYDIDFEIGIVSEDQASTQLTLDASSSADVFMFAGDQLSELAKSSLIMKIADSVATEVADEHIEQAYDACTYNGELYAIPFTANLWYMFYNKSMYTEEEVQSLDTMMAKDFPDVNGSPVYNFSMDIDNGWYIAAFFYAGGCTLYGENGDDPTQCDWAEDKGIAVVDYLNSLMDTGKFYLDTDYDSIAKLKDGTIAAFCSGSWNANAIKEALGENYAAAVAPQVTINGTTEYLKPFADFKMIGVNALCQNQQAAQLLAQFLAGSYAQTVRLEAREIQPTTKLLVGENSPYDYEKDYPAVQASINQMEHTVNRPSTDQIKNYWKMGEALGSYIFKQKDDVRNDSRQQFIKDKIVAKIVAS